MGLIEYSVKNRICYITLNRPEKKNALNPEMVGELKAAFAKAESEEDVKLIVLGSKGDTFCSGADLGYLQKLQHFTYEENLADSQNLKELFLQMYRLKKVIIAQVQGSALAGGCGLITVCDFVIAVPEARFGYTEVKIGFVPAIVMIFLLRKIGESRARGLLLTGNLITAGTALELGIVHKLADQASLVMEVDGFAKKLIEGASSQSLALTKSLITEVQHLPLEEALDFAARENAAARATDDCKKGIEAFLKKEPLTW